MDSGEPREATTDVAMARTTAVISRPPKLNRSTSVIELAIVPMIQIVVPRRSHSSSYALDGSGAGRHRPLSTSSSGR
jgi:hypothetical protein